LLHGLATISLGHFEVIEVVEIHVGGLDSSNRTFASELGALKSKAGGGQLVIFAALAH